MDEIYDPFKEDEDNGQERVKTETRLNDPSKMTLLPHERAVQDGSGFSRLVGTKYGVDPTAKAEKRVHMGIRWCQKAGVPIKRIQISSLSSGIRMNRTLICMQQNTNITQMNASLYRERSQSVEYQKVNPMSAILRSGQRDA